MADTELLSLLGAALETAVNGVLALDPETRERLAELRGRVIAFEIVGLGATLYLIPGVDRLNVYTHHEGMPDTTLRGSPLGLLSMGLAENAGDSFFAGDVSLDGDVELGSRFREILDGLDIDWEEHLSRLTGDVVAHKAGELLRGALAWGGKAIDTLSRDGAEYLQEERRDLPSRGEVEDFLDDVDTLRSDADRLAARVERLEASRRADDISQQERTP